MEAKELMIGDWVCCINGDRHYPKAPKGRMNISGYGSGNPCKILRLQHIAIVEANGEKISEYGSLKPIPLTEEILKTNGFEKTGKYYNNSPIPVIDNAYWQFGHYRKEGFRIAYHTSSDRTNSDHLTLVISTAEKNYRTGNFIDLRNIRYVHEL